MRLFHNITMTAVVLVMCVGSVRAANTTITAKLDSALLLMGNITALHLEIVQDKNAVGMLTVEKSDTLSAAIEIAQKSNPDTTDLVNGRIHINRDLILQSFDSGMYVIKPIGFVVGSDTFSTQQLTLKVIPVKVDSLKDIHDFKTVEVVPFKLFDWVPDFIADYWWIYLLVALLIAAALYYYLAWYKKGRKITLPGHKRLSPYDEAIQSLQRLKADNLWQNGREKEYFTALTDILRIYIDRRFLINAVEMTSTQIIDTLRKNEETRAVNEQLSMILEIADIVKFANVRPLADDNEMAFQRALNFVETTKPVEQPTENNKEETAK